MTVGLLIGIVVGLCAGLVIGMLLRARRNDGAIAEARLAEGRLADAQAVATRIAGQLEQTSGSATELRAQNARLVTELEQAHRSAQERAQAWEEDRERLTGTFAQLSSEALRSNAEQFLTLAETKLRETQETARGELGQRQEAITQQLAPLQRSPGQVRVRAPSDGARAQGRLQRPQRAGEAARGVPGPAEEGDPEPGHRAPRPPDPGPLG